MTIPSQADYLASLVEQLAQIERDEGYVDCDLLGRVDYLKGKGLDEAFQRGLSDENAYWYQIGYEREYRDDPVRIAQFKRMGIR